MLSVGAQCLLTRLLLTADHSEGMDDAVDLGDTSPRPTSPQRGEESFDFQLHGDPTARLLCVCNFKEECTWPWGGFQWSLIICTITAAGSSSLQGTWDKLDRVRDARPHRAEAPRVGRATQL